MPRRQGPRYLPRPYDRTLFQGDILRGVPLVDLLPNTTGWILLRPPANNPLTREDILKGKRPAHFRGVPEVDAADAWQNPPTEIVIARATKLDVMLVTQSCDLDHRKHYHVAPVVRLNSIENPRKRDSIRGDEVDYLYYLPANPPDFPDDCFADLTKLASVHNSYCRDSDVVCRLTSLERWNFQSALANLHGKPFGFNPTDAIPASARYGCVGCFLSGRLKVEQIDVGGTAQDPARFPACDQCGDDTLWIEVR